MDDLAELLRLAITGSLAERWRWYRGVAEASPLWTRQQHVYEEKWGSQTTEVRGVTAWRVMSHNLEKDAPVGTDLGVARLWLEVISRVESADALNDSLLQELIEGQHAANIGGYQQSAEAAIAFFEKGGKRADLPAAKREIGFLGARKGMLLTEVVGDLVTDAKPWLVAVFELQQRSDAPRINDVHTEALRIALPFLDTTELEVVLEPETHPSWRRAATHLIWRRLSAFPGGHVDVATVYEYAFGRSDATKFRTYLALHGSPALEPPPPYEG